VIAEKDVALADEVIEKLRAEIERLRLAAENDATRLAWHDATLAERDAEIERLRADLLTRDGQAQELQGEVAMLREVIRKMEAQQAPLEKPFAQILSENLWDLYAR
jgi:predicted  nucleic acid-binding Zn-ribbon protein